jgi:hypothetical protein
MTSYTWQLGIDWNAVETVGVSYLRGGLVNQATGVALAGTNPVQSGDTITFRIFDVSSSGEQQVDAIGSFVILSKAAVNGQGNCKSLSSPQPATTPDVPSHPLSLFGPAHCSWTAVQVAVEELPEMQAVARFLLTVQVQAIGFDGRVRLFSHDPEMIVGGG